MTQLSNYAENALGNHMLRGATAPMTAVAQCYLSLHSSNPAEDASGTELTSAGGYARKAINFSAPTDGDFPNSNLVDYGLSSAAYSGAASFVGIWDALTVGNLLAYGPNIIGTPQLFVAIASSDIYQCPGHGFVNGDLVRLIGTALPTGVDANTAYYVITSTTDTFQLSLTNGGASINITANGWGRVAKDGTQTVTAANQQITVPIGNLHVTLL